MHQLVVVYGNQMVGPFRQNERHQAEAVVNRIREKQKTKKAREKRLEIKTMTDPALFWHIYGKLGQ